MPRTVTNKGIYGETYNANDVIGLTLFARQKVNVYSGPGQQYELLYTVEPGGVVGIVYSWVNKSGIIWWQLEPGNKFVSHAQGKFDIQALKDQGLISTQEQMQNEAEANKPWWEKVIKQGSKTIITLGLIGAAAYAVINYKKIVK